MYYFVPACCSGSSRFCARTALSGLRGRPTGPDGSHLVLMPPPSLGGGGSGGGSRGGPVGSFALTSLSHSSLQRHAPRRVMRLSPKACSWSIPYSRAQLEFRKQAISACRSLPVIAGKFSNTIYQPRRVFTFAGHRSKYIRERFRFSVSSPTVKVFGFVTNGQSFRFRHQQTKPIVSIDGTYVLLRWPRRFTRCGYGGYGRVPTAGRGGYERVPTAGKGGYRQLCHVILSSMRQSLYSLA